MFDRLTPKFSCKAAGLELSCRTRALRGLVSCNASFGGLYEEAPDSQLMTKSSASMKSWVSRK